MIPWYRSGKRCVYCQREFSPTLPRTKDHLIPSFLGGPNHYTNYAPACRECNKLKAHMTLPMFAKWLTEKYNAKGGGYHLFPYFPLMARNAWKIYNKTSKTHKKYIKL